MRFSTRLRKRAGSAIRDAQLQHNLRHTLGKTLHSRDAAVAGVENWEALRSYARAAKMEALSNLGEYLVQLESMIEARGGRVIWAANARQATEFILELAHKREFTRVVKSKSMLGEEMDLNQALEDWMKVVETDLGEYIVQLMGHTPSHIVAPALHLSREQVAGLFQEKLDMAPGADVAEITATARSTLRRHFLQAQMGITGVNFGIAETGTLVVVENEGNARLTISAPRVHVAIMGIEKVIPRLQDLSVFLKLLTRSATGQKITSYVNLIQGPRTRDERDGPQELYLVLVDNGRSQILADERMRQTLACIRCGACLNACPVFQTIGGHAYGSTYPGPIGAILTPQLKGLAKAPEHPFASTLCGACREVCPVGIEIPEILLELRHRVQEDKTSAAAQLPFERSAFQVWSWLMASRRRYEWFSRYGRSLLRLTRSGWARRLRGVLFPPLARWSQDRTDLVPASRSFRDIYQEEEGQA